MSEVDASRIYFRQILSNEKKDSTVVILKTAIAYYQNLGITVKRAPYDRPWSG